MSWNDTNQFPHTTFWWEGHDGSRLLAHFPPANTYSGTFDLGELSAGQEGGVGAEGSALNLYPYGHGDGGGGPTAAMIERYRRTADVEGLPKVEVALSADSSIAYVTRRMTFQPGVGELYLEAHRATLRTHADVKLANRRGEEALRAAEMWSVAAGLDRRRELDGAWKNLLLEQFHDILPGSSIHWVYEDTRRRHTEVLEIASPTIAESLHVLARSDGDPSEEGLVSFDSASSDRSEGPSFPTDRSSS